MKKTILTTVVLSLTLNLFADEANNLPSVRDSIFKNTRESASELISNLQKDEVESLYKDTREIGILRSIISDRTINRCATKVIAKIKENLNLNNEKDVNLAVLGLRLDESIDDVSAKVLLNTNELSRSISIPFTKDELNGSEEEKALEIFKTKAKDIHDKNLCIEDTYRELVGKLAGSAPKFLRNLKQINKIALRDELINDSDFKTIEMLRRNKVYQWPLTLSEYAKSLEQIAKQFSGRVKESSTLVTSVKFRQKKSLRQALYEKYNGTQIIILANMVKALKARLESKDITITINYIDRPSEIISLEPMEKFRFILKLLRKELANLNNSSLLGGQPANYMDLIAASYEVGYIKADEVEQLASLQEIWNPSITPKQKAMYWVKTFGGMASVLLPPPFGFVSVMAIMLIDQQIKDAPVNRDSDFNLF
jgi:uncharacterized protein (UPF0147 family)